jgi:hypothetical protein
LHHELKGDGILVMSVIAGIVNTRFRDHVLGGIVPEGVACLKRTIEPEDLACSIANALAREKRVIFNPRIGRLFWALELCLPGLMHLYLQRCWTSLRGEALSAHEVALAHPDCSPPFSDAPDGSRARVTRRFGTLDRPPDRRSER